MIDVGLYENRQVVFKEAYRKTSHYRDACIEERVRRVEERSIYRKHMNSDGHCAENDR